MKHKYYYTVLKLNGGGYSIGIFRSTVVSRSKKQQAVGVPIPNLINFFEYLGMFHETKKPTLLDPFTVELEGKVIFKLEDPQWIAKITATLLSKT